MYWSDPCLHLFSGFSISVCVKQVKRHFHLSCDRLQSVSSSNGTLWCCKCHICVWHVKIRNLMMAMKSSLCVSLSFPPGSRDNIMEVWRNGSVKHRLNLPEQQKESAVIFSSVLLLPEVPHTHRRFEYMCPVFSLYLTLLSSLCLCVSEGGAVECVCGLW